MSKQIRTVEHYVASIDLLGMKDKIKKDKDDKALNQIRDIFHSWERISNAYDFEGLKVRFFSDNVVVAIETSYVHGAFCAIDILLDFVSYMAEHMLECGFKPRGGVCKGNFYMDNVFVWGEGLVEAYRMESELAKYPRIIVHEQVRKEALNRDIFEQDEEDKQFLVIRQK